MHAGDHQRLHELFCARPVGFRGCRPTAAKRRWSRKRQTTAGCRGTGAANLRANAQTDTGSNSHSRSAQPKRRRKCIDPAPEVQARPGEEPLAVVTGGPLPPKTQPVEPDQKSKSAIDIVQKQPQTVSHGLQLSPRRARSWPVCSAVSRSVSLVAAVALTATDGNDIHGLALRRGSESLRSRQQSSVVDRLRGCRCVHGRLRC